MSRSVKTGSENCNPSTPVFRSKVKEANTGEVVSGVYILTGTPLVLAATLFPLLSSAKPDLTATKVSAADVQRSVLALRAFRSSTPRFITSMGSGPILLTTPPF